MARKTRGRTRRGRKTRRSGQRGGRKSPFTTSNWWESLVKKEIEESEKRIKAYCQKKKEYSSCMYQSNGDTKICGSNPEKPPNIPEDIKC
jgi:hypothetical protein